MEAFFARHEFQISSGNLPHIHTMLKILWALLTQAQREFVRDLIRADVFEIVKPNEVQRFYDERIAKDINELKMLHFRSMQII